MAQIVENLTGRRMVRLSPADVLTVVQVYQRQLFQGKSAALAGVPTHGNALAVLSEHAIYLPEEL